MDTCTAGGLEGGGKVVTSPSRVNTPESMRRSLYNQPICMQIDHVGNRGQLMLCNQLI